MTAPFDIAAIQARIIACATRSDEGEDLLEEVGSGLLAAGLPVWRAAILAPTIDPTFRGVSLEWQRDRGVVLEPTAHGPEGEAQWARSPASLLIERDAHDGRWRLDDGPLPDDLPLLEELRRMGGTDYVLHLTALAPGTALRGIGVSFASDRPGGFSDADRAALLDLVPTLALATAKLCFAHGLREVLGTYLGRHTAAQVLDGRIRRGQGEVVPAAILLADLRRFTTLADREEPQRVVAWLDEHLDAIGEPVARHGGEISKFLGDGFLAVFPVPDAGAKICAACASALAAAHEALARNAALHARRAAAGEPTLLVDLVLHYGHVVSGNVGTGRRLDFTVIGRAVNEASRIERLCEELGQPLLMSDAFARRCAEGLARPLGEFALRGIERRMEIWAPDGETR